MRSVQDIACLCSHVEKEIRQYCFITVLITFMRTKHSCSNHFAKTLLFANPIKLETMCTWGDEG